MKRVEILNQIRNDYDFIVEIGAGPMPYHGSDLIIDKYPFDNTERCGDINKTAPLIKADACSLPFINGSVDLLFMSQVIEHLPDPILFLEEARRVARDIYIECPSIVRESIFGWSFHRWAVEMRGNKWIFYKNNLPQLCGDHFHNESDIFFTEYTINNFEKFNNFYYGPVETLEFEVSDLTALEYLSQKNQNKVNFPTSVNGATYTNNLSRIIYFLFKNLLSHSIKKCINKLSNKSPQINKKNNFHDITNNKLMCIFCKEPLKGVNHICCCGSPLKSIYNVISFDKEDYQNPEEFLKKSETIGASVAESLAVE